MTSEKNASLRSYLFGFTETNEQSELGSMRLNRQVRHLL
nr:MAG TPA: Permease MlaE [Caudoviricetes sp.]